MKTKLKLLAGALLAFFAVVKPVTARLDAAWVQRSGVRGANQALLYAKARETDPCNTKILEAEGDAWLLDKNYTMATVAYGNILHCAPANAMARFRFGMLIVLQGFTDEHRAIEDAIALEPTNPIFKSELAAVKARQSRLQ